MYYDDSSARVYVRRNDTVNHFPGLEQFRTHAFNDGYLSKTAYETLNHVLLGPSIHHKKVVQATVHLRSSSSCFGSASYCLPFSLSHKYHASTATAEDATVALDSVPSMTDTWRDLESKTSRYVV